MTQELDTPQCALCDAPDADYGIYRRHATLTIGGVSFADTFYRMGRNEHGMVVTVSPNNDTSDYLEVESAEDYIKRIAVIDYMSLQPSWSRGAAYLCVDCFERATEVCEVQSGCEPIVTPTTSTAFDITGGSEAMYAHLTFMAENASNGGFIGYSVRSLINALKSIRNAQLGFRYPTQQIRDSLSMQELFPDTNSIRETVRLLTFTENCLNRVTEQIDAFTRHHDWDDSRCELHEDYVTCDSCDDWLSNDDTYWVDNGYDSISLCQGCFDNEAHFCDSCDRYELDNYDCPNGGGIIHDYGYKPEPIFFYKANPELSGQAFGTAPNRNLFMGMELEVEARGAESPEGLAELVQEKWGDKAYFKHDGSLNNGVEIVTHPMDLATFMELDWSALRDVADNGGRSWNTSSCGLHIHLSRSALHGNTHIWLLGQFFAANEREIKALVGRDSSYAVFGSDFKGAVKRAKKSNTVGNRYLAINYNNRHTIEMRVFKGSLKVERVKAMLQFAHAAFTYAGSITANNVLSSSKDWEDVITNGALSWIAFKQFCLDNATTYWELCSHLTGGNVRDPENQNNNTEELV